MRHTWTYGNQLARQAAKARRCQHCGATGSRWGRGSASWQGIMPDGSRYSGRIPSCPGTPWVRRQEHDVVWVIGEHTRSQHFAMITPQLVASFGRRHVEEIIRRNGHPPLPEAAWADFDAKVAH